MARALILFAHGSRDPDWARPFERLVRTVRRIVPGHEVQLAFLELMHPDLRQATAALVAGGATGISVVPVFLGQGGHIRRDLPALVEDLRTRHPGLQIDLAKPAGEDDQVLDAIAAYCAQHLERD